MNDTNVRIQVVVENTAYGRGLLGEHGLSYFIDKDGQSMLFDTGAGLALANNAVAMGIDLARIEKIGLSHGHFDHAGGLSAFETLGLFPNIYAHPAAFQPKFSKRNDNRYYPVGVPSVNGLSVERFRERLTPVEKPVLLAPGIWMTGPVPRMNEFENTSTSFFLDDEGERYDELVDDQSIFFIAKEGIVIILGCAHSGIINTIGYIRSLTGDVPIHHVIGGMHLVNASKERIQQTIEALLQLNVQWISPCHCTGVQATLAIHNAFGDRCKVCPVGTELSFELE